MNGNSLCVLLRLPCTWWAFSDQPLWSGSYFPRLLWPYLTYLRKLANIWKKKTYVSSWRLLGSIIIELPMMFTDEDCFLNTYVGRIEAPLSYCSQDSIAQLRWTLPQILYTHSLQPARWQPSSCFLRKRCGMSASHTEYLKRKGRLYSITELFKWADMFFDDNFANAARSALRKFLTKLHYI